MYYSHYYRLAPLSSKGPLFSCSIKLSLRKDKGFTRLKLLRESGSCHVTHIQYVSLVCPDFLRLATYQLI